MNKLICGAASLVLAVLMLTGCSFGKKEWTVGKDLPNGKITEFYYTYSRLEYPAEYQRYHFYIKDEKHYFFHDHREKDDYGPLTEADSTSSGKSELSDEEWQTFLDSLAGGTVKKREESMTAGDSGPWFYLYWKGDKDEYQEYSFPSVHAQAAFEDLCLTLKESR